MLRYPSDLVALAQHWPDPLAVAVLADYLEEAGCPLAAGRLREDAATAYHLIGEIRHGLTGFCDRREMIELRERYHVKRPTPPLKRPRPGHRYG